MVCGATELNFYDKARVSGKKVFAVAPMIDWTDRHCRYLHRQLSSQALLYTEMVVADAIIHGPRDRLLSFSPAEHPVALQLGGSDAGKLTEAIRIAADYGYDEIGLNVGCPSDRVQSGTFGACLMRDPGHVADLIAAMKKVSSAPVTVKCRIGVDDQEPNDVLPDFLARMIGAGADAIWIHARKAWLQGLSPKENREIPPLDYDLVHRMKRENPDVFLGINGGIADLEQAKTHLAVMDGVMVGRAAYQNTGLLVGVDAMLDGSVPATPSETDWLTLRDTMIDYAQEVIASGGRLHHVTRHIVGLFQGFAGARRFRQILSSEATRPGAGTEIISAAFAAVDFTGSARQSMTDGNVEPEAERAAS
jgi:tRNA-dihydrouridine synthase A